MSRINPRLNLNKTPQSVEDNTLVYAKNIRLFSDNSIGPDNTIREVITSDYIANYLERNETPYTEDGVDPSDVPPVVSDYIYNIVGHINGLDNNIYLFIDKIYKYDFKTLQCFIEIPNNITNITKLELIIQRESESDNTFNINISGFDKKQIVENIYSNILSLDYPNYYIDFNDYVGEDNNFSEELIQPNKSIICIDNNFNIIGLQLEDGSIIFNNNDDTTGNIIPVSYKGNIYYKYQRGSEIFYYNIYNIKLWSGSNPESLDKNNGKLIFDNTHEIRKIITEDNREISFYDIEFCFINNALFAIISLGSTIEAYNIIDILYYNNHDYVKGEHYIYLNTSFLSINEDTHTLNKFDSLYKNDDNKYTYNFINTKRNYNITNILLKYYKGDNLYKEFNNSIIKSYITNKKSIIIDYNEITGNIEEIKCNWHWSGGIIEGITTVNNTNQPIITINEYFKEKVDIRIPLKHINTKECSKEDNESIYTQAPCVPITNLHLIGTYTKSIPNGVYQFFVRYKIRDNFYTNWFVCSKECFAGSRQTTYTIFGTLAYVNTKGDAGSSFVFNVEHLHPEYFKLYQGYQLGFILTTDEKVIARSWKTFVFDSSSENVDGTSSSSSIQFDLNEHDCEEVDIDEMLSPTYDLYNVKNVDYFRGKLYVSNYIEDDFNPSKFDEYIKNINIELKQKHFLFNEVKDYFDGKLLHAVAQGKYDKVLDLPVNTLLENQNYRVLNYTVANPNTLNYNFNDTDNMLLYLHIIWNSEENPDLAYIDILKSKGVNIINFNDEGRRGRWKSGGVFFERTGILDFKEKNKDNGNGHWLKGDKYFDGIWYCGSTLDDVYNNWGDTEHYISDKGFTESRVNSYINTLYNKVQQIINENIPLKVYITKIVANSDIILYDSGNNLNNKNDFSGIPLGTSNENEILSVAINYLKQKVNYIDNIGLLYIDNTSISSITVQYSEFTMYPGKSDINWNNPYDSGPGLDMWVGVDCTRTEKVISSTIKLNTALFKLSLEGFNSYQYNTLMPYTDYDFYIHYVTDKGVITNGLYIGTRKFTNFDCETGSSNNVSKSLIYPEITNIVLPKEYKSCFISYYKNDNNVAQGFEIVKDGVNATFSILEFDLLLYPVFNNIQLYDVTNDGELASGEGNYYPSYSLEGDGGNVTAQEFGNAGVVKAILDNEVISYTSFEKTYTTIPLYRGDGSNVNAIHTLDGLDDKPFWYSIGISFDGYYSAYVGNVAIYLCLDKNYCLNTSRQAIVSLIQGFLDAISNNSDNPQSVWTAFETDLANSNNNGTYKNFLYNYDTFALRLTSNRVYCAANNLSGHSDKPLKFIVSDNNTGGGPLTITIKYNGDKTGFKYIDDNNVEQEFVLTNILIGSSSRYNVTENVYTVQNDLDYVNVSIARCIQEYPLVDRTNFEHYNIGKDGSLWYRNKASISIDDTAKKLIKLTPYLTQKKVDGVLEETISFSEYAKMNTDSYVCQVVKPIRDLSLAKYVADTSVYKYISSSSKIEGMKEDKTRQGINQSVVHYIYSNFNLNYISLSEDLVFKLREIQVDGTSLGREMFIPLNSSTLSDCYTLKSMYKSFTRKSFLTFNRYNINIFDNTVRASNVNRDESYKSIYKFDADDTYSVPTNRGKITNMFSIGNSIYLHTEHSLYKFSGENKLSGTDNEVKLEESDVFDTGISEIFDSENGFGGLHEKHNCIVTYNSYFFYDKRTKMLYDYAGDGNLTNINQPIQKLLNFVDINEVKFASDTINDRIFIKLFTSYGSICLSYSIPLKGYVSIHDIDFNDSFSTRNNTYFITKKDNENNIINNFNYNSFGSYGNVFNRSCLHTKIEEDIFNNDEKLPCIIDVLLMSNVEEVKNLDNIQWICHHIKEYAKTKTVNEAKLLDVIDNAAEEDKFKYPGEYLRVYSDECDTGIINLYNKSENKNKDIISSNAYSIYDTESYKYPRFNEGIWFLNYFRNIKDVTNPTPDNMSLIYGKYFVVRFIFDAKHNFKLENVIVNYKNR